MPCPRCGSHDIWDDNLAWGCHACPWFTTGEVRNTDASRDNFITHEEYRAKLDAKAVKAVSEDKCKLCGRTLDDPDDETTRDCGGDCLRCMAVIAEDEDCIKSLEAIMHKRRMEGGR